MNTYYGSRNKCETVVMVHRADSKGILFSKEIITLNRSLAVRNHSPTGFEWGYSGSGPAQLALAILIDHFGNKPQNERPAYCLTAEDAAQHFYQDFKADVICMMPAPGWDLTNTEIEFWIKDRDQGRKHFRIKWQDWHPENNDVWRP